MNSKTLLLALSVAAFSSCSTAYKSGQTPDDVYYSPVRVVEENNNDDKTQEEDKVSTQTSEERQIRWSIRDRRWRDLDYDYDYDYSYRKSPYGYCHCACNNTGYYYNPYYSPWPVYNPKVTPINSTPRMINLGSYKGYNNAVNNIKSGNGTNWANPQTRYNNSNRQSGLGRVVRQILAPSSNSNNNNNSNNSNNNNTRTYTPSSSNTNSSSGSSSSGSSVSRPARGGK